MTVHGEQVSPRQATPLETRRAVRGAAIGNTVEWFDFAVYSVLATYIADKFFPSGNDTVALLNGPHRRCLPTSMMPMSDTMQAAVSKLRANRCLCGAQATAAATRDKMALRPIHTSGVVECALFIAALHKRLSRTLEPVGLTVLSRQGKPAVGAAFFLAHRHPDPSRRPSHQSSDAQQHQ